jgi:hypothetical protein
MTGLAGIACGLAVLLGPFASVSHAGCGDYVHVLGQAPAHRDGAPGSERFCRGPNCTRNPMPLPGYPQSRPVKLVEQWALLSHSIEPVGFKSLLNASADAGACDSGYRSDILRPPRS